MSEGQKREGEPVGPDAEICLCFHVTRRKVENFIRVERPRRAAQLSECFGAGTGCGWCRPFLEQLFAASSDQASGSEFNAMTPEEYARRREAYRESKRGEDG